MHYDPVKEILGRQFNRHPLLRKFFYVLLNILACKKSPEESGVSPVVICLGTRCGDGIRAVLMVDGT